MTQEEFRRTSSISSVSLESERLLAMLEKSFGALPHDCLWTFCRTRFQWISLFLFFLAASKDEHIFLQSFLRVFCLGVALKFEELLLQVHIVRQQGFDFLLVRSNRPL